ncbi:hypothetical protein ERX46_17230 [Brumimicrobium glaciale]|uniref:Tetratricopeptide repeat protein n=1 Tax=Brumimicrobium glaciale TaxID=200475 RepID=A0A4Q4KF24_9FLAO|nr:hypothetical protein [Brumimicrobium glaciale]RYM30824.1 hypothetical protein ERX46_17230 [Brumimicrobium glaciale]
MKNIITALTVLFISLSVFSQETFEDLLIIKADADWEKLIKHSERYTNKSSSDKEPVPYYFLAYGLYKISFQAERGDEYKGAYKDAFTAIGKMLRYDKTGEVQEKYSEFINELKLSLLEIIQNETDNEEYRRAFGWTMRLYKFGRDYVPALYLEGALRSRNNDQSTARIKWEEANTLVKDQKIGDWSEADQKLLMLGLYQSAKALKDLRQPDKAKEMMDIGAPYFEEDKRWEANYDDIVN